MPVAALYVTGCQDASKQTHAAHASNVPKLIFAALPVTSSKTTAMGGLSSKLLQIVAMLKANAVKQAFRPT